MTILVSSTMTRVVKPGETVCMSCNVPMKTSTTWYGQECNKTPFVIISAKYDVNQKEVLNKFLHGNNNAFSTKLEDNGSISLTISNINEYLLGFYYCTSGIDKDLTVGSGYILEYEKGSVSPKSDDDDEKLDGCSTGPPESSDGPPECSGQCWVLMAIFCPLSAALVGLLAFILTWILHRKGNNESDRIKTAQGHSNDVQGMEQVVLYTSFCLSNGDHRGKRKNTHH
ncbi:uncharacterized protein LOC109616792 isoform X2 [Esox lucius]|uniref:uncharacterized protein LOC109616792 isoform X2 n=1 Tax=Esox lucius TaxID=8010 RepID=UPI00147713A7|nr:uncharacterized protein LOC109616792 isoform X2 [Esox lucius]